jgi:hypothetical protein
VSILERKKGRKKDARGGKNVTGGGERNENFQKF